MEKPKPKPKLAKMEVHDPPNNHKIDEIYLFVSRDDQGNEGVVAAPMGNMTMPLIASTEGLKNDMKNIAEQIAKHTKKEIHLLKFTTRTDVERIK